jgi:AsmA protein
MARNLHRLILWLLAGLATLAVLVLLVLAALRWWLDPNDFRPQLEARASSVIGRPVRLTGALRWQLGTRIYLASEGGEIANAPGFGSQPLLRWSGLRLSVAARPLFDQRVLIDRVDIDGLQVNLQRNAQGANNWELKLADNTGDGADSPVALRIDAVAFRNAQIHYQDAASGADWRVTELAMRAMLPQDMAAADLQFRDIDLAGRMESLPLANGGVPFAFRADSLRFAAQQLQVPALAMHWGDARLEGGVSAQLGAAPVAKGALVLNALSLRALLTTVRVTPPPMSDPTTLGALRVSASYQYAAEAISLTDLTMKLDDTSLSGELSLPRLEPLALRFDLRADHVDLDRYREPDDVTSEPFELPLAALKALDAQGVLRIQAATIAGAAAKELRIDVE